MNDHTQREAGETSPIDDRGNGAQAQTVPGTTGGPGPRPSPVCNLYLVQDPDRPMYVVAETFGEAVARWEHLVRDENDGELGEPCEGVQLICSGKELLLPGPLPGYSERCESCGATADIITGDDVDLCRKCAEELAKEEAEASDVGDELRAEVDRLRSSMPVVWDNLPQDVMVIALRAGQNTVSGSLRLTRSLDEISGTALALIRVMHDRHAPKTDTAAAQPPQPQPRPSATAAGCAAANPTHQVDGVSWIQLEREKQRAKWGDAHDDEHTGGELPGGAFLLLAALLGDTHGIDISVSKDPWGLTTKHVHPRDRLVVAGALIAAELDRRTRAAERRLTGQGGT